MASKIETESESEVLERNVEFWKNRWENQDIGWNENDVNPNLVKFLNRLTSNSNGSTERPKKIFVPLCGKTRDISYLLTKGFQVFGVEGVKQAIQELDEENGFNLRFNEEELLYSTQDDLLQIYVGDLFKCPIEKWGPFDCVWDRGSFVAIEYPFRTAYKEIVQRGLRDSNSKYCGFKYLLDTVRYDKTKYAGTPRSVDAKDMKELFDDWTNVEVLSDGPVQSERVKNLVGSSCDSVIYLLTPKSE